MDVASIIIAIITALGTILAVVFGNRKNQYELKNTLEVKMMEINSNLEKSQAVTETKIDILTCEVSKHNNFATRIPVLEEKIAVINHRISDLESEAKK